MAKGEDIPKTSPVEIGKLIGQIRETNLESGAKEKVERLLRAVIRDSQKGTWAKIKRCLYRRSSNELLRWPVSALI
jgi:hypothetical protein